MIKRQGKKGIYHCDFRTSDGQRIRCSLHTTDRKEAKELEAKLKAETDPKAQRQLPRGDLTLEEAFQHALRVRDAWRSAKSLRSIKDIYRQVESYFGPTHRLSQLNDEVLLEYGEYLHESGKTPSTINKRLSHISVLFEEAIEWKKYSGNKPKLIRYKVDNARNRIITVEEETKALAILRSVKGPLWEAMADLVTVLADTGLRLSEALKIEARHIDQQSRSVLIIATKNGEDRAVPLTERSLAVLLKRAQSRQKILFHPLSADTANRIWARVRAEMGLSEDKEFVLHTFRRTYASTLANAGTDSFRLQRVMGHKSLLTTQRYVKVSTEAVLGLSSIIEERTKKGIAPPPSSETDSIDTEK